MLNIGSIDAIRDILDKINNIYESEYRKLPYQVNLLDEIHANENAHTRILLSLLRYEDNHDFPILKSFINLIKDSYIQVKNPNIEFNTSNIDGLILESNKYAIIIENKIHWAVDQKEQIDRYVKHVINERQIPASCVYVIYLTSDGNKEVSDYSMSDDTKATLGERYVRMNYKYDILPWLNNVVLPNCTLKQDLLASAIKQYIDHLRGMFGLRDRDYKIYQTMKMKTEEVLGIDKCLTLSEKYNKLIEYDQKLEDLKNIISSHRTEVTRQIMTDFFIPQFKKALMPGGYSLEYDESWDWNCGGGISGFRIKVPGWDSFEIGFEFTQPGLGGLDYGYVLNSLSISQEKTKDSFSFWTTLQDRFGAIGRNNPAWIYKKYAPFKWWSTPETIDAIIDGTLVQRLLKDIDDLVDIASEFDM